MGGDCKYFGMSFNFLWLNFFSKADPISDRFVGCFLGWEGGRGAQTEKVFSNRNPSVEVFSSLVAAESFLLGFEVDCFFLEFCKILMRSGWRSLYSCPLSVGSGKSLCACVSTVCSHRLAVEWLDERYGGGIC